MNKRVQTISETDDKVTTETADGATYHGSDQEDLPYSCTCLVGQTEALDVEEFSELKDSLCPYYSTLGDSNPYTEKLTGGAENSELGLQAAQSMCDEICDFLILTGTGKRTLGDMFGRTPKDLISKVMLEERVFTTWHSGRTVLLGDAYYKAHPAGGQGSLSLLSSFSPVVDLSKESIKL
ncbi:hypothetical protein BGW39_010767 [Mortierella sp. 14UC]|nr:hypothetical protein BGW39_010767 [Mortierella sp. 14UC]